MRKLLRVLGVIAALALLWLGLVLSEWLPRPTPAQLAAIALLEPERAHVAGERNAFAAIWLLGYDVPEADLEAVAAADAAAFLDAAQRSGQVSDFKSTAEGKYTALPAPPNADPVLCETWGSNCLARVRANPEASRARVTEFAKRLERGDRLAKYDHYRYGFLPRYDSPIGGGNSFSLQLTATALDYLDGDVGAAFTRICRETATWRRLRAHSDALIMDMLGVTQMSNAARLYAEMLAEQPADFVVPCPEMFAPLSDTEVNQCAVIRQEFIFLRNTLLDTRLGSEVFGVGPKSQAISALVNRRHLIQADAQEFARQCGVENQERIRRRDPAPLPVAVTCDALAWTFDPAGCYLIEEEMPAFNGYYQRVLDLDVRLRLLQSAIWLRSQPIEGDRVAQFNARPTELQSATHTMTFDAQRSMLRMTNLQKSKGEYWDLPFAIAPSAPAADPVATPAGDGR